MIQLQWPPQWDDNLSCLSYLTDDLLWYMPIFSIAAAKTESLSKMAWLLSTEIKYMPKMLQSFVAKTEIRSILKETVIVMHKY